MQMSDIVHCTDEDVRKHRVLIDRRERAEQAARKANWQATHPRTLVEYLADGDECASSPIVPREEKHSVPEEEI
jgi:hypothetical protein